MVGFSVQNFVNRLHVCLTQCIMYYGWFHGQIQLSFRGIEGDYRVQVAVHSLVLLESRCAECYGIAIGDGSNFCCDFSTSTSSCPSGCDIILRFCQLSSDLSQFNSTDRLLGTMCPGTPLFEEFLGFNLMAGVTYSNSNRESLQGGLVVFSTRVVYNGAGQWKGAQFIMSVVDRDSGEIDDLIDYFSIPIDISAGSSLTSNFTGIYNYTQLELTIEVTCTAQNNTDESCGCLPGFTGPLCEDECIGVTCSNRGQCVDEVNGFHCECYPGFTGQLCEIDIDNCIGITCSNRGRCVDGVTNSSCVCDPGYTGATCDTVNLMASSSSTVAIIAGGVIGGLVAAFSLIIIITLLLLFIIKSRTKAFGQAAHNAQEDNDLHDYDEVDNEIIIETKECAAYAVQKKVDLESNPAHAYIMYTGVGGDQVTTVEMRECAAYGTQEVVATTDLEANSAYQSVTTGYETKECPAYGTRERVITEVNPAYQIVTTHS